MATIEEYIVQKGVDLVWQNPRRDKNVIVKMARLSPRNGYNDFGKIHYDCVECPTEKGYYHFYQLGDNYPGDFSLIARKYQWYRLDEWCKVYNLIIRIYDKHGRMFPLKDAYTMRTYNDNIIIAVLRNDFISDINEEELYINFYRNFFYYGVDKDSQSQHIEYFGLTVNRSDKPSRLLSRTITLRNRRKGNFRLTYNGYLVENIKPDDETKFGEVGEILYDMSIRKVVDLPLNELRTFKSELDKLNKYLLHPPKDDVNIIDYRDDIEIWVCHRKPETNEIRGLYYHRNMEDSVRMVTHRDWSVPVPYVMGYVEFLEPERPNLDDFFIRIYIRDNGPEEDVIDDANMVTSLYLLDDRKIIEAMTAVDSTVPEWKASNLEQSAYTALMRSYRHEITPALVLDAFGYSTTVRQLAYPNQRLKLNPNGNYFDIPVGFGDRFVSYEYDEYGRLLGWYNNRRGQLLKYYPKNATCIFVELFSGTASATPSVHIAQNEFTLKKDTAYRFYLAKTSVLPSGVNISRKLAAIIEDFQDATNDERIKVTNDKCIFQHDPFNEFAVAMGDDIIQCYNAELDGVDGIYDFSFRVPNTVRGIIPPAKIDIWMNGYALVEDIDFFVDWPNVMIVSKRYVESNLDKQKITVRGMGFPFQHKGGLRRVKPREVGFVQYGEVSVDNHYDIHSGKVIRAVVDGGVFDPDVIPFDEKGNSVVERFAKDGSPYSIETPYISLSGVMGVNLYRSQIKDYDLTMRASDYLSMHVERYNKSLPPILEDKYEVYSPFLGKIAADLKYGRLLSPLPKVSIADVDKIIEPYKKYLNLDPVIRGYNKYFVNVHAHPYKDYMELNARDIAFIKRLNQIYLRGEVDTSKFFQVMGLN